MSNVKKGDLARALRGRTTPEMNNLFVVVEREAVSGEIYAPGYRFIPSEPGVHWLIRHAVSGEKLPTRSYGGVLFWGNQRVYADRLLRAINGDQPGNEYSFKAAPKSLPATTKGDTIDARGEVA